MTHDALYIAAAVAFLGIAGCNTIEGAGRDVSGAGSSIERSAAGHGGDSVYTYRATVLRAGPNPEFPPVERVYSGATLEIYGCLSSREWCDVSWRGNRGWMQARDIGYKVGNRAISLAEYSSRGDIPTVSFDYSYWDSNYRTRSWYRDRAKWEQRYRDNG
jgi:predicted small secreted protein